MIINRGLYDGQVHRRPSLLPVPPLRWAPRRLRNGASSSRGLRQSRAASRRAARRGEHRARWAAETPWAATHHSHREFSSLLLRLVPLLFMPVVVCFWFVCLSFVCFFAAAVSKSVPAFSAFAQQLFPRRKLISAAGCISLRLMDAVDYSRSSSQSPRKSKSKSKKKRRPTKRQVKFAIL